MARIEVYSTFLCPFCYRAKTLLDSKGVAYEEIDVMLRPDRRAEMTKRSGGRTSVPQVFVNGVHIGNCDELCALEAEGELDAIIGRAAAE